MEYYQSMKKAFSEKVKFVVAEIPAARVRKKIWRGFGGV